MKLSVIIPAFNEQDNISATLDEISSVLEKAKFNHQIEIIVVDDHSSDATLDIVVKRRDSRVQGIRLSRRSGSHTAIRAGLNHASGDCAVFLSADGQDNPECLPQMLEKWKSGSQVVWAVRPHRKEESWLVRWPAQLFYRCLMMLGGVQESAIDLARAEFCLMDRKVVDAINHCEERNTSLFGLICWLGFQQNSIEYTRRARRLGKSKWNFRNRLRLACDWIVAFSGLPLKLMTVVGFYVAGFGFLYAIIIMFNAILGKPVAGWSSTMVIILILGGVQMMMLGVLGEYLWRNLDESRKRPLFFIEKET